MLEQRTRGRTIDAEPRLALEGTDGCGRRPGHAAVDRVEIQTQLPQAPLNVQHQRRVGITG